MKTRTLPLSVAFLVVTGLLSACSSSKPPETTAVAVSPPADTHAAVSGSDASDASGASQPAETADAATPIPDTADAIWKAIDQQSADLKASIQNGALKDVHHKAYAIRDLVAALPTHTPGLAPDAQAKLQQDVKFVATLAERLDAAGDSADKADAEANYRKLVAVLGGMTRFP